MDIHRGRSIPKTQRDCCLASADTRRHWRAGCGESRMSGSDTRVAGGKVLCKRRATRRRPALHRKKAVNAYLREPESDPVRVRSLAGRARIDDNTRRLPANLAVASQRIDISPSACGGLSPATDRRGPQDPRQHPMARRHARKEGGLHDDDAKAERDESFSALASACLLTNDGTHRGPRGCQGVAASISSGFRLSGVEPASFSALGSAPASSSTRTTAGSAL